MATTSTGPDLARCPARRSRSKSRLSRSRSIRPTAADGPGGAEPEPPRDRLWSASDAESRACGRGGECSADRCASSTSSCGIGLRLAHGRRRFEIAREHDPPGESRRQEPALHARRFGSTPQSWRRSKADGARVRLAVAPRTGPLTWPDGTPRSSRCAADYDAATVVDPASLGGSPGLRWRIGARLGPVVHTPVEESVDNARRSGSLTLVHQHNQERRPQ